MLVMPAIDLRDGHCVQLVGGSYDAERVREPDPARVAARWRDFGFARLHVVDLDAATGVGFNTAAVDAIRAVPGVRAQVGGGVRSTDAVERLLEVEPAADAVVVGTRALEDPEWIAAVARRWPFRVVAAVDVRDGTPLLRGWRERAATELDDALDMLDELPLAALLVTCVDVEGQMRGPDLRTIEHVRSRAALPLVASGGIATLADLRELDALGVWAAVVGMALYTGTLDPRATAEEFGR